MLRYREQWGDFEEVNHPTYIWHEAWTFSVTRPGMLTMEALMNDPKASAGRGIAWVVAAAFSSLLVTSVAGFVLLIFDFIHIEHQYLYSLLFGGFLSSLLYVPVAILICYLLWNGILQFVATKFGGRGSYSEFYYATATFTAPLLLIQGFLVPFLSTNAGRLAFFALSIYFVILTIIALKTVNGFGTRAAIASFVIPVWCIVPVLVAVYFLLFWIDVLRYLL